MEEFSHHHGELQEHMEMHLRRIEHKVDYLIRRVEIMAVSEEQFKNDFASFMESFNALLAAVDVIASKPPVDLTDEDNAILAAAQAAKDELAKISPTPVEEPPPVSTPPVE